MNKKLKNWKTLIVDDERLARAKLQNMLAAHPNIEIVGDANSVAKAVEEIEKSKAELVFLDVQMPGESGFQLLHRLQSPVKVIFVTAFDQYAIRAFEVNALDYLLKPVTEKRLAQAIERLGAPEKQHAPENLPKKLDYDDALFVNTGREMRFVRVNTIKLIEAEGMYTKVSYADGTSHLLSKSMNAWEQQLPEKYFVRIHRSTIVNIEQIERIEKWFNYSFQVHLKGKSEPLTMSRRYAARLKAKM